MTNLVNEELKKQLADFEAAVRTHEVKGMYDGQFHDEIVRNYHETKQILLESFKVITRSK